MTPVHYWPEQRVFEALKEAISSGAPSDDFLLYLKDFQLDKLTTGTPNRPPNFYMQCVGVMTVMSRQLRSQGHHQVIKQIDIPAISPVPNFLSVIAVMCYIANTIELTNNIGYGLQQIESGIKAHKVAYVEIIVGDEFARELTVQPQHIEPEPSPIAHRALLTMDGNDIFAEVDNKLVKINDQKLRTDLAPYSLMKQISEHPSITVTLAAAQKKLQGCERVRDLSEVLRQCGFNEEKKEWFFATSTAKRIKLRKEIRLTNAQVDLLENNDRISSDFSK